MSEERLRFDKVLERWRTQEAYLRERPDPALLMEPFGVSSTSVDTPSEGGAPTEAFASTTDHAQVAEVFALPSDMVHDDARVVWLTKSERNPFVGMITVGRASNNDIVIANGKISKMHAIFHRSGDEWLLEDRGSTNKTFMDGVALPDQQRRVINDGARLRFADLVTARFFEPASFYMFAKAVLTGGHA
jgi:FHA domain